MTDARALNMLRLSDLSWPVTYRYRILAPWGVSQHDLTMDTPPLANDLEATARFARSLWGMAVAGATSFLVHCQSAELHLWKWGTTEIVPFTPPLFGMQPHLASNRGDTPAVQMHSGHADTFGVRRFPLIGAPSGWTNAGFVTDTGLRIIEQTFQRLKMGAAAPLLGGPLSWLIAYQDVSLGPTTPAMPLGFRRVEYVRCLWHTLRAPDASVGF